MKDRVAILTTFQDFNPGYSLTGIVTDQLRMLQEHGHEVDLYTCTQFNHSSLPPGIKVKNLIPFAHLIDYTTKKDITPDHMTTLEETSDMLVKELKDTPIVFTHDFLFTGWNLPYGLGVLNTTHHLPDTRFLHWIHSVPTAHKDWWMAPTYGPQHKMIFPNDTDKILVAEQYQGTLDHVRCVHHIKDLRTWFDFHEDTCRFIKAYPAVMQADVVKIYPASVDRLSAKRVREVILIMGEIKKRNKSVCLVIAAQWATGRMQKENVDNYKRMAESSGLTPDEVIFTPDFEAPKFDVGIHKQFLRELMLCSNLFIFPTREESFGLVFPEACLSSAVMPLANKSLRMLGEIGGNHGLYFDFGSYHHEVHHKNATKYYQDLAVILLGRMRQNESISIRTHMRQTYNYDNLYYNEYEPLFAEAKTWS
jgi:hypothetical protein